MKVISAVFVRVKVTHASAGKTIMFGPLKYDGKVFVCIIPNAKGEIPEPIIRAK